MQTEKLIHENDTPKQEERIGNKEAINKPALVSQDKKKKKHNSALLAVAKARSEAIHKTGNSAADGLHPIGTNITYKDGDGVL